MVFKIFEKLLGEKQILHRTRNNKILSFKEKISKCVKVLGYISRSWLLRTNLVSSKHNSKKKNHWEAACLKFLQRTNTPDKQLLSLSTRDHENTTEKLDAEEDGLVTITRNS